MTARVIRLLLSGCLLLTACTRREPAEEDDSEWADVLPLTNSVEIATNTAPRRIVQSESEDYAPLTRRLEEMVHVSRAEGETLITGESLVFDYERRFVRMDGAVKVADDHGELKAETLTGRFSEENKVELIEARRDIRITSGEREAAADSAVYSLKDGAVQLDGRAHLAEGGNRLSGERMKFWITGSRRTICAPGARLEITGASDLRTEGIPDSGGTTVITSDRLIYDEEQALAEFEGNVRMRDPRAAMDCERIRLHLKEDNKMDWIEALSGVIIQSDDRKALADRAIYYADDERFVLEGDPKVQIGRNITTADRIIFWPDTRRVVWESNARVLLYPDEEMKAKFLQDLKD